MTLTVKDQIDTIEKLGTKLKYFGVKDKTKYVVYPKRIRKE